VQTRTAKEVEDRSEGKARGRERQPEQDGSATLGGPARVPVLEAGCELAGDRLRQRPGGVRPFSSERVVPAQATDEGPRRAFVEAAPGEVGEARSVSTYVVVQGRAAAPRDATVSSGDRPSMTITSRSPCGSEERTYGMFCLVQGRDTTLTVTPKGATVGPSSSPSTDALPDYREGRFTRPGTSVAPCRLDSEGCPRGTRRAGAPCSPRGAPGSNGPARAPGTHVEAPRPP
jgi:hypothetical protein